jgi:hypothetical protein
LFVLIAVLFAISVPSVRHVDAAFAPIRFNAGGPAFTDSLGQVWAADMNFSGGTTYSKTAAIAGTVDDTLFQTERYGNFSYNIPVPNGAYTVTLLFAEIYWTSAGKRVFNVSVEGQPAIQGLDIYATVGANTALVRTVAATVTDGVLTIAFTSTVDNAKVSAIQVTSAGNQAPVVSAGSNQTITLPTNAVTLTGTATDDGLPSPPGALTYNWSVVSGPGPVTLSAPMALTSVASFTTAGTYTLQLAVSDSAISSTDDVVVFVNPAATFAPVLINAGGPAFTDSVGNVWAADKNFSGGTTYSKANAIAGTVDDALFQTERYGTFSYNIPVPSGTYSVTLRFAELYWTSAGKRVFNVSLEGQTVVSNLDLFAAVGANTALDRTFQITVTDGTLNIGFTTVVDNAKVSAIQVVSAGPPTNQAPVVNAGPDKVITLPTNSVALSGTATDDGLPSPPGSMTYAWSVVSGPAGVTFSAQTSLATTATFPGAGTYTLRLTANDSALSTSDDVIVTVNATPVNQAPVANAGPDKVLTLPTTSVALTGTATDDGLPAPPAMLTYAWTTVSGPAAVTFSAPTALSTTATFTTAGTYTLRLSVSDSALTGTDDVIVTVNPVTAFTPVRINAGGPAFTDSLGQVWAADKNFSGGTTYSNTAAIAGTVDDTLFQTERYGTFSYNIPVPNGAYTVTLLFAELYWTSAGKRVFSVSVEGQPAIQGLDIYATVGATTALVRTVAATVTDGVLTLTFTSTVDYAKVSAIQVTAASTVPNVVNQTQAAATTAITGAGLVVGTVTTATSATVAAGSVISQNPVGGTQVAPGSAVSLVVSTGPPVSTSPVAQCLESVVPSPHHSTLPQTTTCVIAFSDQIHAGLPDLYIHFAATHFAGAQKMLKADNDQLRAYNPNWVALHYQLGMAASPAEYIRGVMVGGSLVAQWSASWPYVNTQESWFMHNDNSVRHCGPNNYNCILNISDQNVQSWWLDEAVAGMRAAGAQGVFADTFVEGISGYDVVPPDNRFASTNPANPSAWPGGVTWLDQRLNWITTIAGSFAQTPEQFLVIPNIGSGATGWDTTDFASSRIDGAMLEGIALDFKDTPDWILEMNRAVALTSSGKIVLFQTYPGGNQGTSAFQQDVNYALASYLLIKGDYTYINLPGGNTNKGTSVYYYPQYEALEQLGGPLSALPTNIASYLWSGVYRRDFQHGFVLVNPSDSTISITLPEGYQQLQCSGGGEVGSSDIDPATSNYVGGSCSLQPVTSIALAPWSGAFFFDGGPTMARANSYDNAWKSAWVDHGRALLATPGKTAGFVLEIGDSITHARAYSAWAIQGQGMTADDALVAAWARSMTWSSTNTDTTSKNGWYLTGADTTTQRGMTSSDGLSTGELVTGCCNNGPTMPATADPAIARQLISNASYPGNIQIDTLVAAFRDAQFAVVMLGTNDPGNPTGLADLASIVDRLEAAGILTILSTIPPRNDSLSDQLNVEFNAGVRALAQARGLPLIDFHQEIVLRRPDTTWFNTLISSDGVHPTGDRAGFTVTSDPYLPGGDPATFTTGDAPANVGYLLRSWLTVQKLKEVKRYVVDGINP